MTVITPESKLTQARKSIFRMMPWILVILLMPILPIVMQGMWNNTLVVPTILIAGALTFVAGFKIVMHLTTMFSVKKKYQHVVGTVLFVLLAIYIGGFSNAPEIAMTKAGILDLFNIHSGMGISLLILTCVVMFRVGGRQHMKQREHTILATYCVALIPTYHAASLFSYGAFVTSLERGMGGSVSGVPLFIFSGVSAILATALVVYAYRRGPAAADERKRYEEVAGVKS